MQVRAGRTMVHDVRPTVYTSHARERGITAPPTREPERTAAWEAPFPPSPRLPNKCRKASLPGSHSRRPRQQRPTGEERRRRRELAGPAGRSRAGVRQSLTRYETAAAAESSTPPKGRQPTVVGRYLTRSVARWKARWRGTSSRPHGAKRLAVGAIREGGQRASYDKRWET